MRSAILVVALLLPLDFADAATPALQPPSSNAKPAVVSNPKASQAQQDFAEALQPSIVTLNLGNGQTMDMEIIQWPDGGYALPVKALTALFGIAAQQPLNDHRLLFVDSGTGKKVELDWQAQTFTIDGQSVSLGSHPLVYSDKGLVNPSDLYVDQSLLGPILQSRFSFDEDTTALSLSTPRKLNVPGKGDAGVSQTIPANIRLVGQPNLYRATVEKVYLRNSGSYIQQAPTSMGSGPFRNNTMNTMLNSSTVGVSGSILGQDYYLKPTFAYFNGRLNFQAIDWSIQHATRNAVLSLGSADAGLSALSSPSLNVWGLKFASKNAVGSSLMARQAYEFSGKAGDGHEIQARINGRTVQSTVAQNDGYALEAVYLQPQAINHLQVVEVDEQKHETVLVDKKIANFMNLLPRGETAYSAFAGRAPLLFYPPLPGGKSPWLMPQSEKWLAGGRAFYGLTDRITVGASVVADKNFGQPRTYYTQLDPFSIDLTGINSYLRDSNFFNGQNMSVTMRAQMTDHWLLSSDMGISRFTMLPGSRLPIGNSNFAAATQFHLERQGSRMTWFMDAFRYGSNYYTPAVTLYGNNLYDRRGFSTGVNGTLSNILPLSYSVKWNHYQTNFLNLIPGGTINANQLNATLSSHINDHNDVILTLNSIQGKNEARNFDQHAFDLTWRTQSLPWKLMGEVRASRYYTNTIFFPGTLSGVQLTQSNYTNNALDINLTLPFNQSRTSYLRLGNRVSTFVDYAFAQASFRVRQFSFEPLVQVSYGNRPQIQNRFGLKVGYTLKSGATFSVGFYKNFSTFALANTLGSTLHSQVNTNQFYCDFSDILSLFGRKVKSLGPNSDSSGLIVGKIFADYQANNLPDRSEPGVRGVQLLVDKHTVVQTDNNGLYTISGISAGYHTIELMPESLPLVMGAENPIYKVKVGTGKTQRLDIPLNPEGGTISGRIQLTNAKGQVLPSDSLVLVLNDEHGKVVNYTTPDGSGFYQFANIAPGRYQVSLESKLKASGRYHILQTPAPISIKIPKFYEESIVVGDQDLKLLAL